MTQPFCDPDNSIPDSPRKATSPSEKAIFGRNGPREMQIHSAYVVACAIRRGDCPACGGRTVLAQPCKVWECITGCGLQVPDAELDGIKAAFRNLDSVMHRHFQNFLIWQQGKMADHGN